ncbi:MAG TPA: FliH/SctL family protein [Nevskiaceae bacterium]
MAADDAPATAGVQRWTLPTFHKPPTAAAIEEIEQQAWQEGDARGYADGLKRGADEITRRIEALDALVAALARPLAEQEARIAQELQAVAWSLGELLARRQLAQDPEAVARLVAEAVATLAMPEQTLTIQVAPAQHAALEAVLQAHPLRQPCHVESAADLEAGDCRVVVPDATADARLAVRLRALADRFLDAEPEKTDAARAG